MNKFIALLVCILYASFFSIQTFGLNKDSISFTNRSRFEFELGYGTISLFTKESPFFNSDELPGGTFHHVNSPVNVYFHFLYNVAKKFGAGISISQMSYNETIYQYIEHYGGDSRIIGHRGYYHMFTIGPVGRSYWFYWKHFAMYTKYGFTFSCSCEDDFRNIVIRPNVSIVGLEIGGDRWRAYCEPLSFISMWPGAHAGIKYLF